MSKALFAQPRFTNDDAAREHLESLRWPNGAVCPHCGGTERNVRLQGKSHRPGLWFCGDCRTQFTVTVGTVFERSKVPLHKWLLANHLICAAKKGISAHQLHRMLGVTYKTAWFMTHRIREAMTDVPSGPLGGSGKIVEVDETYWGRSEEAPAKPKEGTEARRRYRGTRVMKDMRPIVALVERDGKMRGFHMAAVTKENLREALAKHVHPQTHLMTDEARMYRPIGRELFAQHSTVNHGRKEYARGNVTTNTVEGFFAILKRGLIGTFHHVGDKHLQRYVNEFAFRYNNRSSLGVEDIERAENALRGISGKRLMYGGPRQVEASPT
jgi:transposase-like protein